MKRLLLLIAVLVPIGLITAQEVLPGICVNSRQPVQVYLNGNLVCENSLNCVMVNLRPLALYQVEVRSSLDPSGKPLFKDRVKAPEKGIQTVVVRSEDPSPVSTANPGKDPNTVSTLTVPRQAVGRSTPSQAVDPMSAPNRANPIITEDRFEEFMVVLDKASPDQVQLLIEARIAQNNFWVKHVKQIIEMHVPGDTSRVSLIKRMYSSIADRENAFQLVNSVNSPDAQQQLSEFIAKYNATHPL